MVSYGELFKIRTTETIKPKGIYPDRRHGILCGGRRVDDDLGRLLTSQL